jgi:hypothetical protein
LKNPPLLTFPLLSGYIVFMQQTQLDHFLKKRFVYRYEISCNRIPPQLPKGITLSTGKDSDHGKWGHLLLCDDEDAYQNAIALLRSHRILFFPTINEREGIVGYVLNPERSYGSFTWNSFWGGVRMSLSAFVGGVFPRVAPLGFLEALRNTISAIRPL